MIVAYIDYEYFHTGVFLKPLGRHANDSLEEIYQKLEPYNDFFTEKIEYTYFKYDENWIPIDYDGDEELRDGPLLAEKLKEVKEILFEYYGEDVWLYELDHKIDYWLQTDAFSSWLYAISDDEIFDMDSDTIDLLEKEFKLDKTKLDNRLRPVVQSLEKEFKSIQFILLRDCFKNLPFMIEKLEEIINICDEIGGEKLDLTEYNALLRIFKREYEFEKQQAV